MEEKVTDFETPKKVMYPGHQWGLLAKDPWLPIGSDSESSRLVLRRYWLRNGGEDEAFDRLFPSNCSDRRQSVSMK
jgi:hypothetical protein